ncbi:hypothetical protein HDF13_002195 [Edaphobacter lichenicola]|uniref:Uncharacterized protein n=1 Tax=Tunturiibacter gelidiferens TaxID=3069689 RepID=A0ACC5NZ63_9BACT|nr:hypothetical protein [Edaphobacter lichenicola]
MAHRTVFFNTFVSLNRPLVRTKLDRNTPDSQARLINN